MISLYRLEVWRDSIVEGMGSKGDGRHMRGHMQLSGLNWPHWNDKKKKLHRY